MGDMRDHYGSLATSYDELWLYSEDYVACLAAKIAAALQLDSSDRLVDIGCGTGLYARALRDALAMENPIVCADSSEAMLAKMTDSRGLHPVVADAITLLEGGVEGDKFLMKEVIHHIEDKRRFFEAVARTLRPGGVFLILLLPPTIDYPLFKAALRRYEELQPDYRDLLNMAAAAGLAVEAWLESIPLVIDKSRYLRMVAGRYMSLLSTFSDAEIAEGVREIDERHPDGALCFDDTFVFLRIAALAGEEANA